MRGIQMRVDPSLKMLVERLRKENELVDTNRKATKIIAREFDKIKGKNKKIMLI